MVAFPYFFMQFVILDYMMSPGNGDKLFPNVLICTSTIDMLKVVS